MKTYKGIIFDLDGTLLDTINDLTDSVNDVMKIYGWKEYDSKACKMMVGNGFRKLIQRALPEEKQKDEMFLDEAVDQFSKAYQKTTGIAGYTLVSNSYELKIVAHEPFVSRDTAIREETDIHSDTTIINKVTKRKCVLDTDNGKALQEKVADLEQLLWAYQKGLITERIL